PLGVTLSATAAGGMDYRLTLEFGVSILLENCHDNFLSRKIRSENLVPSVSSAFAYRQRVTRFGSSATPRSRQSDVRLFLAPRHSRSASSSLIGTSSRSVANLWKSFASSRCCSSCSESDPARPTFTFHLR